MFNNFCCFLSIWNIQLWYLPHKIKGINPWSTFFLSVGVLFERQRQKMLPSLVHFPKCHSRLGRSQANSEKWRTYLVSYMVWERWGRQSESDTGDIICCLSGCEPAGIRSEAGTQTKHFDKDHGPFKGILIAKPNTCPYLLIFIRQGLGNLFSLPAFPL